MGYSVRTINLGIKSAPFRSDGGSKINVISMVEHDFRQYEANGKSLPKHIDNSRVKDNLILYLDKNFQKSLGIDKINFISDIDRFEPHFSNINNIENTYNHLLKEYEKEKKDREYFTWLKSTAPHFCGFIINFSKLAQKEIVEQLGIERMSYRVKSFCLDFFERIMGVKLIYLVGHFDESAPHYHGLVTNHRKYSYQYKKPEQILNDPYFRFLTEKYFIADLIEKLANGLWRTFSGTFTSSPDTVKKSKYCLPFSFLQDVTHYAFKDIGFERGKSKAERLAEGEPLWKLIARDVKTLHEDLPKEIELKKQELGAIVDTIVMLREEKEQIEQELLSIKNRVANELKDLEETQNNYKENVRVLKLEIGKLQSEKEELLQQIKKISETPDVYSQDEMWFLTLMRQLIESKTIDEIYEILEKLKHNKLFRLMMHADNYTAMVLNPQAYSKEQIDASRETIKSVLEDKGIHITEILQEEEEKEIIEKEKERERKNILSGHKKQLK